MEENTAASSLTTAGGICVANTGGLGGSGAGGSAFMTTAGQSTSTGDECAGSADSASASGGTSLTPA